MLLGVFIMMGGWIGVVIQPSMEKLIEDVTGGTLDFVLTKPEEAQVLVSVNQVRVWRIVDVAAGVVIIAVDHDLSGMAEECADVPGAGSLRRDRALAGSRRADDSRPVERLSGVGRCHVVGSRLFWQTGLKRCSGASA